MFAIFIWLGGIVGLVLSVAFKSRIYSRLKIRSVFLQKVGLLTYPLYLNHFVLGMTLVPALVALGLERPFVFALSFAAVLGSSWFIMSVPEPALQATLFSFSSRWSKAA
jgi:peptidoglycan/LPS O-acetylase OafA/YrhL